MFYKVDFKFYLKEMFRRFYSFTQKEDTDINEEPEKTMRKEKKWRSPTFRSPEFIVTKSGETDLTREGLN